MNNIYIYSLKDKLSGYHLIVSLQTKTLICQELNLNLNLDALSDRCYFFGNNDIIIANNAIYTTGTVEIIDYNNCNNSIMFSRDATIYTCDDMSVCNIINIEGSVTTFFNTFLREFCGSILLLNTSSLLSFHPETHGLEAVAKTNTEIYFYCMNLNDIKYLLASSNSTLEQTTFDYIKESSTEKISPYWNNILNNKNSTFIKDNFYKCTIQPGDNIFYINTNLNAYLNRSKILIRGI